MASQYLLCAFGPDRTGLVEELSECILKGRFNILDSRMTILGDHFSMLLLVAGNPSGVAGLQEAAGKIRNLTVQFKDVQTRPFSTDRFEYAVRIMGNDTPGLVHAVTGYLKARDANVASMETWMTHAPHSGTEIFNMNIVTEVSRNVSFREFKDGLIRLCDTLNLEAEIEPYTRG
ncbi:MAG: ACT domain-containing protein [Fibrobacterota bacterium]